jgi:hypothetical protein
MSREGLLEAKQARTQLNLWAAESNPEGWKKVARRSERSGDPW